MWPSRQASEADKIAVCPSSRILILEDALARAERERDEALGEVAQLRREVRALRHRLEAVLAPWWQWWRSV